MSDETDNNPKAFPMSYPGPDIPEQQGMSLRDYFAAAALQGLLARKERMDGSVEAAKTAYNFADAMLEARKPEEP